MTVPVSEHAGSAPPTGPSRRDVRMYVSGATTSTFGSTLTAVTVSVLAVTAFGVTGAQAGLLAAAGTVPTVLVGLYAGVLSDRLRRPRLVLISTDLAAATAVLVCALGVSVGAARFAWLVGLEVALGLLACLTQTVFFIHLNALVSDGLPAARGQLQSASYLAGSGANAVAGSVIAAVGPVGALVVDAATYLISAASLRIISSADVNPALADKSPPATGMGDHNSGSVHHQIAAGISIVRQSALRHVVVYAILAQSAFIGASTLKAIFLLRTLELPVYLYGIPGIAAAVLGALGSMLCARLLSSGFPPARVVLSCWSVGALALLVLPMAGGPLPVALTLVVFGISVPVFCGAGANVAVSALISQEIPEAALGRVSSSLMVIVSATTMAGALASGWLADLIGVRATLWCCGALGVAGLAVLQPLWKQPPLQPTNAPS